MKKISTLALAGLVAVTTSANASVSYWNGFGAANAYIACVQDIWTLPGSAAVYKNALYSEFGVAANPNVSGNVNDNPTNTWGGVHGEAGPGVLGIWVNRPTNPMIGKLYGSLSTAFSAPGTVNAALVGSFDGITATPSDISAAEMYPIAGANGRVDVLYAFGLNDSIDLGILLSRANRNAKVENVGNVAGSVDSFDASGLGFGIGAEFKELAIFKLLEVGLIIDTDSMIVSSKTTANEDKIEHSASVTSLRVGGDTAGEEGKFGRVELGFSMGSASSKNGATTVTPVVGDKEFKTSGSAWNLGYAMGKRGEKGMGLMGLMLAGNGSASESDAANTKSDRGEMSLQLTTAGEAKVKEWLTARAGMAANLYQSSNSTAPGATNPVKNSSSSNGATTLTTGLTVDLGGVTIDGVLNQDVLYTGGFLVSGVAESLFSQVSATWAW